jgi:hypothetical protein
MLFVFFGRLYVAASVTQLLYYTIRDDSRSSDHDSVSSTELTDRASLHVQISCNKKQKVQKNPENTPSIKTNEKVGRETALSELTDRTQETET